MQATMTQPERAAVKETPELTSVKAVVSSDLLCRKRQKPYSDAFLKSQRAKLKKAQAVLRDHPEKRHVGTAEEMRSIGQKFKAKRLAIRSKNPRMQSDENHCSAKWWHLRDPSGEIYHFKNIAKFVREHSELFEADDLKMATYKNSRGNVTRNRAMLGLRSLRPSETRIRQETTWKGWTWLSIYERRWNDGDDLLERSNDEVSDSRREKP